MRTTKAKLLRAGVQRHGHGFRPMLRYQGRLGWLDPRPRFTWAEAYDAARAQRAAVLPWLEAGAPGVVWP